MNDLMLRQALIFLGAALICVPIAKKLGLGSVLGYLLAGVLIGPFVLGFVGEEGQDIMHAAEFGVVMMLFLIGLELEPQAFWRLRKAILGMGLSQLLLSTALLFGLLYMGFGLAAPVALVMAVAFSMSSTAIAFQMLKEKNLHHTAAGQASFAVLLMQDVAVIPVLALLPLMAGHTSETGSHPYQVWISLAAIGLLILLGRYAINPFLRLIARTHMREMFTASALLIVIGVAFLMHMAGISAALGAFTAGVLLANSEYRHELESDVEPFKGLLLGLFFTAVGSTINFQLIAQQAGTVSLLVLGILIVKAIVLLLIGRTFGLQTDQRSLFALLVCQVGEFAFVLLSATAQIGLTDKATTELGMAATTLTMALSPLLMFAYERGLAPHIGTTEAAPERPADEVEEKHAVIIAGFGHFGSTIGRFLRANGIHATYLDHDSDRVDFLRKTGFKVYYGDCTRVDLLKAAGADQARYLICALDSEDTSQLLYEVIQAHFPHLQVFMRTKHRFHAYQFMAKGLQKTYRESLYSSVFMGVDVMRQMGFRHYTATRKAQEFIKYDEHALGRLAKEWGNRDQYIFSAREEIALQEKLLSEDARFLHDLLEDNAWDSDSLRQEAARP